MAELAVLQSRGAAALRTRLSIAANAVAFQTGWFAAVLGAAYGMPAAGAAVAALVVAAHLLLAQAPAAEARLAGAALGIGLAWEGLLMTLGLLRFPSGALAPGVAPAWLLILWPLFAITLNHSLAWLRGRLRIAAVLGAAAGPLSYWAGHRLGALEVAEPLAATALLAAGWAVITPALVALAARWPAHGEAR